MPGRTIIDVPAPEIHELINLYIAVDERKEQLGEELAERLERLILWEMKQQLVWPQPLVDLFRYATFYKGTEEVGYSKAGQWAADRLKGSPWEASAHTMEASYKKVQRSLHRRPRTYRPRVVPDKPKEQKGFTRHSTAARR